MDWASRYTTPLSEVFTRQHKLELEWRVELALLKVLGELGKIPKEAYPAVKAAVDSGRVTLARTLEIEESTQHDIMAVVKAMAEQSGEYGGFVHYGATSQDINDTVLALQLLEAKNVLLTATAAVRVELSRLSAQYKNLACIGRTHGQHAIPITMGFKLANFLYEVSVSEKYLERVELFGKFSGAVGNFASLGSREVETALMKELGIQPAPISTQVVSRLHLADLLFAVSAIASALERLGKEIRNLQRTEIGEASEGFGVHQVGSSTMPQKRNPHKSERICGIARVVRSQLPAMLETIAMEHERDLTNSSVERITVPSAICLTHYILLETQKVLVKLSIDESRVSANLHAGGGKQVAERVMMALASKIGRQQAHELLRIYAGKEDFVGSLKADPKISAALSSSDLDNLLNPATYIGLAPQIVDNIIATFGAGKANQEQKQVALSYRSAGVDIDAGEDLVSCIKPYCRATRRPGADADLGGFGGLFDLAAVKYKDPLIVACTDGVGTKLALAKASSSHGTVGIDLVAMSVNDLIVQGAEPLIFLDYYATGKLLVNEAAHVIKGIANACQESECALIGGETAEMPGMYHNGDYDLAGFAVGIVERDSVLPRLSSMKAGDVILGLSSSGIHSNGVSLVRRIIADTATDLFAPPPYPSTHKRLCDDLLTPTKLYVKPFLQFFRPGQNNQLSGSIKGLAHITGGGLYENIPRVLPAHLACHLDASTWPILPVFKWLQRGGRSISATPVSAPGCISVDEMARTYNVGIGMVVVVDVSNVDRVTAALQQAGQTVYNIGTLQTRNDNNQHQVQIQHLHQAFQ